MSLPIMHKHKHKHKHTQLGLSLVELLVAMFIGLILLLGISVVFVQGRVAGRELEDSQKVQEGARNALDRIAYSLRLTKQAGCIKAGNESVQLIAASGTTGDLAGPENMNPVLNPAGPNNANINARDANNGTPLLWDRAFLRGYYKNAGFALPSGSTVVLPTAATNGLQQIPDALYLAGADADYWHLSGAMADAKNGGKIPINVAGHPLGASADTKLYVISDCVIGTLFYGKPTSAGNELSFNALSNTVVAPEADPQLKRAYSSQATVSPMQFRNYFVAGSADPAIFARDGWVLYERREAIVAGGGGQIWSTPRPLLSNITNFNVVFGVDTDGDGIVDTYQTPDVVESATVDNPWGRVRTARIALGVRGKQSTQLQVAGASPGFIPQNYTVEVEIRN